MSAVRGQTAVIGTGVIGASWAALFLAAGHEVIAADPAEGAEQRLHLAVQEAWPVLEQLGLTGSADPEALTFTTDVAVAVQGAGFVQESGPERLDVKRELMAALDRATPPGTVIASSSSGYQPSQLQAMCEQHPERVVVGHPFHPAHLIPLVEVVPGNATAGWAVEQAFEFYAGLGKRPIRVNQELPGHVANRLQAAIWREAYSLVERGVVTVAEVDAAITCGPGVRWAAIGPILGQHLSGGSGGLAHTLEHLGLPAQVWMDDLARTQLSPRLAEQLVHGVDAEIEGTPNEVIARERDEFLVQILRLRASTRLP